jgi:hypothetical protein
MSECVFTPEQREIIRAARREKEAWVKSLKKAAKSPGGNAPATEPLHPDRPKNAPAKQPLQPAVPKNAPAKQPRQPNPPKISGLNKLEKMLYLQQGKCFFCGEPLKASEASIEHLQPISQGGQRVESNEVVCHRSVNEAFGPMDLKRKIEFILRSSGIFRCPKGNYSN